MEYLTVRNFERFQHYRNRKDMERPSWIKLYASLLHDYEFQMLPDETKGHLMLIWILVSQRGDHVVPNSASWVERQIGAQTPVNLKLLIDGGWLVTLERNCEAVESNSRAHTQPPSPLFSSPLPLLSSPDPDPDPELPAIPETPAKRKPKVAPEYTPEFLRFWEVYPRKDGKQDASNAWLKLKPDERETATADVPLRIENNWAGKETDHLPHPATYLNSHRWEDGLTPPIRLPNRTPRLSPGMEALRGFYEEAEEREQHDQRNGSHQNAGTSAGHLAAPADRRSS